MSDKNMELWNQVCNSDPKTLTAVTTRGGFTSIAAQSQIRRATELWGPYGKEWGVKDCKYGEIKEGGDGGAAVRGVTLDAVFFCPVASFEIGTDIAYGPHGDCRKKLLTDLTTKALSKLGFNSDVFEGKFDGQKYFDDEKKPAPKTDRQLRTELWTIVSNQAKKHNYPLPEFKTTADQLKISELLKKTPGKLKLKPDDYIGAGNAIKKDSSLLRIVLGCDPMGKTKVEPKKPGEYEQGSDELPDMSQPDDKPPAKEKVSDDELKSRINSWLDEMSQGNADEKRQLIEDYSTFAGKDGPVSECDLSRINGKWLKTLYGNVKKAYKNWNELTS